MMWVGLSDEGVGQEPEDDDGRACSEQVTEEERLNKRPFLLEACGMSQGREDHTKDCFKPVVGGANGLVIGGRIGDGCSHRPW